MGWDIPISRIQVDTRWGVPTYNNPNLQEIAIPEIYLLDGEPLAYMGDGRYRPRVEGRFQEIKRYGTGPADYWWQITDKDGTKYIYGKTASRNSRLKSYNPAHPGIGQWFLKQVIDTNGNTTDFIYHDDYIQKNPTEGEPSTYIYPKEIYYSGRNTGTNPMTGKYKVEFVLETADRPDQIIDGRFGFKTLMRKRLDRVDVYFDGTFIRSYDFIYSTSDYGKSMLVAIAVKGRDKSGAEKEFYRHEFDYYRGTQGFSQKEIWTAGRGSLNDLAHPDGALTSHRERSKNWSIFVGVGDAGRSFHFGGGGGRNENKRTTHLITTDVNGDGLPDRLFDDGVFDINQYFRRSKSFMPSGAYNIYALGDDKTNSVVRTRGFHFKTLKSNIGGSYSRSHTEGKEAIADMNGDGFVDQVVLLDSLHVALNDKGRKFEPLLRAGQARLEPAQALHRKKGKS